MIAASKRRAALFSLLLMFVVSAVATATASAVVQGPIWRVGGNPLLAGEKAINSSQLTKYELKGAIGATKVTITCEEQSSKEAVILGTEHGTGKGTIEFKKCKEVEGGPVGCKVTEPIIAKVKISLWYKGKIGTVNQPYDVAFEPITGATFTKITLQESCGALEGTFAVEGGLAGSISPEKTEAAEGKLYFQEAGKEQEQQHQKNKAGENVEVHLKLKFAKNPAALTGSSKVSLVSTEMFGVFDS